MSDNHAAYERTGNVFIGFIVSLVSLSLAIGLVAAGSSNTMGWAGVVGVGAFSAWLAFIRK
jgi:hypothetical protein